MNGPGLAILFLVAAGQAAREPPDPIRAFVVAAHRVSSQPFDVRHPPEVDVMEKMVAAFSAVPTPTPELVHSIAFMQLELVRLLDYPKEELLHASASKLALTEAIHALEAVGGAAPETQRRLLAARNLVLSIRGERPFLEQRVRVDHALCAIADALAYLTQAHRAVASRGEPMIVTGHDPVGKGINTSRMPALADRRVWLLRRH